MAGPANPLLNPNAPLQGSALLQAARGLANAQTQPVISALLQQIGQNNAQTKGAVAQVGGLYNALGQQAQGAAGQTGQVAAGLNSQLQGIGADESSQLQGIGDNATQTLARYTPGDGSQSAPALQALTAEIARQKGLAAQNEGAFRSFGATQGANYQGLADSLGGTFALGGQEALKNIAQAGRLADLKPEAQLAQEHSVYGADLATALGKLRQQEITNGIARAGLGLKQEGLNVSVGNNQRTNQTSQANNRRTNAQSNLNNQRSTSTSAANNAANNATRLAVQRLRAGTGGSKPLSTSQQNTLYRNLDEMTTLIGTAQKAGHSEQQIRQALQTGSLQKGLPAQAGPLVQAAYELLGYGAISPQTAAAMHGMGLRGGTYKGRPINVARPNATVNNQVAGVNQAAGNAVNGVLSGL